ncbi:MAG TPA: hypothetical protein VIH31_01130 [Candidatus Paceibacterota bacterium]
MDYKKIFKIILIIFIAIFLGTVIDYIVHQTDPSFSVPFSYFPHKIFYGTLWAAVAFFVARLFTKKWLELAFICSFAPALILQTIYFIQMHLAPDVVLLFLILHFFMFLAPMIPLFKKYQNLFV